MYKKQVSDLFGNHKKILSNTSFTNIRGALKGQNFSLPENITEYKGQRYKNIEAAIQQIICSALAAWNQNQLTIQY